LFDIIVANQDLHSSELLIGCGHRLFFVLCTTSLRLSKEDTAYFELEISAEIDRQQQIPR
jgi:hypothetical protein